MPETQLTEPNTSIWPIILAVGLTLIVIGLLTTVIISIVGVIVVVVAVGGWTQEVRILAPFVEEPEEEEGGNE